MVSSTSRSILGHGFGLIAIYSLYGFYQEKIMRGSTYGSKHQKFTSSALLIFVNRIFSISVAVVVLFVRSRTHLTTPRVVISGNASIEDGDNDDDDDDEGVLLTSEQFSHRIRPKHSLIAYASVALCNFLSTSCQYEALKYVPYTTQSLAKCSKMIPVLLVGSIIWGKRFRSREWVAGAVILLGCGTYLFSPSPQSITKTVDETTNSNTLMNAIMGGLYLSGYLFLDGLVSTTQERVFGKTRLSSEPFSPESPVLDQMVWTNVFAAGISIVVALASAVSGQLLPNLELLFTSPSLLLDVSIFSLSSAVGLIILLNTIACFGAVTSSLIMTIRQFLSILINAGLFGQLGSVSLQGWCGVGWVASGIYIKMNKSYDAKQEMGRTSDDKIGDDHDTKKRSNPPEAVTIEMDEKNLSEKARANSRTSLLYPLITSSSSNIGRGGVRLFQRVKQYLYQFVIPITIPLALLCTIGLFIHTFEAIASTSTQEEMNISQGQLITGVVPTDQVAMNLVKVHIALVKKGIDALLAQEEKQEPIGWEI